MTLWRISDYADLIGRAGEVTTGRWHTRADGKRIVYFAEHPAVALIEALVNLRDTRFYPDAFQLLKISAAYASSHIDLTREQTSVIDPQDTRTTQRIGDAWLASGSSALLRVPSIPSPESWNYLFNPLHPDAANLTIEWAKNITYDRRLFRLSK